MITNFDVQQMLHSTNKLRLELDRLVDVKQGSGETTIHLYAYKQLLEEILALRESR